MNCGKPTNNPKFCCSSCSAIYNNRIFPKKKKRAFLCQTCGAETSHRRKYCDRCDPRLLFRPETTLAEIRLRAKYQANAVVRRFARKAFADSGRPMVCQNCGYSLHIEICHIKAISAFPPDTAIRDINLVSNLIALCPNCHWALDHKLIVF
jgi:predicted RNA-binding Zn-ribbon protein involved in translation (DUF1610 family)